LPFALPGQIIRQARPLASGLRDPEAGNPGKAFPAMLSRDPQPWQSSRQRGSASGLPGDHGKIFFRAFSALKNAVFL